MASKLAMLGLRSLGVRTAFRYQLPVARCLSCSTIRWDEVKPTEASLSSQAVSPASTGGRTGLVGFMYEKTGVTGAWTLGVGVACFLVSKEYYVVNSETLAGAVVLTVFYQVYKKVGKPVADYLDGKTQVVLDLFENRKKNWIKSYQEGIDYNKGLETTLAKRKDLIAAMRDANTMELEGEFMRRRQEVTMEMLKRLDYHVQEEAIRRRINHRHMLDWIEAQVSKSLEGKQDETFDQCLNSLRKMKVAA